MVDIPQIIFSAEHGYRAKRPFMDGHQAICSALFTEKIMKRARNCLVLGVFIIFSGSLFFLNNGWAGGSSVYPNGAEFSLMGVAPPPGFYFANYLTLITADKMTDDNGEDTHLLGHMSTEAEVARFVWVPDKLIFGGQYVSHLFVVFLNVDLKFNQPVGPRLKKHYSDTGTPYLIYAPFAIGYHLAGGKVHMILNPSDIYIPFGNTDKDNMASLGRNFWTFEPVFAITFLPTSTCEISFKFMYDFSTSQKGYASAFGTCRRDPGEEFHFDYGISYAIASGLKIGIGGYYYKQTTEDNYSNIQEIFSGAGDLLKNSADNKSEVWAIGPGASYRYKKWFFTLRALFDADSKNTMEGRRYWFTLLYAF